MRGRIGDTMAERYVALDACTNVHYHNVMIKLNRVKPVDLVG